MMGYALGIIFELVEGIGLEGGEAILWFVEWEKRCIFAMLFLECGVGVGGWRLGI